MSSFTIQMRIFSPQDSVILTARGGMNLKGAVLTGANLTAENLCGADLSDADLGGSTVYGGL